jgi:excisionase family DNA binding protein
MMAHRTPPRLRAALGARTAHHQSDQLVSVREAMAMTTLAERTIRRYITEGRLPAVRVGPKAIRLRRSDVEALITARTSTLA